jgi:hypothetical protein
LYEQEEGKRGVPDRLDRCRLVNLDFEMRADEYHDDRARRERSRREGEPSPRINVVAGRQEVVGVGDDGGLQPGRRWACACLDRELGLWLEGLLDRLRFPL